MLRRPRLSEHADRRYCPLGAARREGCRIYEPNQGAGRGKRSLDAIPSAPPERYTARQIAEYSGVAGDPAGRGKLVYRAERVVAFPRFERDGERCGKRFGARKLNNPLRMLSVAKTSPSLGSMATPPG